MGSVQSGKGLREGEQVPQFELRGTDGTTFRSAELLKEGPVMVTFYRGAWCKCCQADLRDVVSALSDLSCKGVTVLGVFSGLDAKAEARIRQEYNLNFPIVNDVDGDVAEAFRIRRSSNDRAELEQEMGRIPLALKGGEPWILPMQARFLIGSDGIVARREVAFDYLDRCEMRHLIPTIERLSEEARRRFR